MKTTNGTTPKRPHQDLFVSCKALGQAVARAIESGCIEAREAEHFATALERAGALLSLDADREIRAAEVDPLDDKAVPDAVHVHARWEDAKSKARLLTAVGMGINDAIVGAAR
ncbi:MAG: hypothetical protein HYR85_09915 [Planctomycetes bacterium]|nr:hypothetical protein [Planctomycetota bacterium]